MLNSYTPCSIDWPPGTAKLVPQAHLTGGADPRAPLDGVQAPPPGLFVRALEAAALDEDQVRGGGG
jgi:hypothetical protein